MTFSFNDAVSGQPSAFGKTVTPNSTTPGPEHVRPAQASIQVRPTRLGLGPGVRRGDGLGPGIRRGDDPSPK